MPKKSKNSLKDRLAQKDPEFLAFLKKENSKLLNFEFEDEDDDDDDEECSDKKQVNGHEEEEEDDEDSMNLDEENISFDSSGDEMDEKMSVENSEEDEKDEVEQDKKTSAKTKGDLISKNMVENWVQLLQSDSIDGLREIVEAFKAVVIQTGNAQNIQSKYLIKGSAVSNVVVNACVVELPPMVVRILNLPASKDPNKVNLPSAKNKVWKKIKSIVEEYLKALLQFLSSVASFELKETVIKHIHQLFIFYCCFQKLSKRAAEKMISLWSTEEESIRVVALGCIVRLVLHVPPKLVEDSLKRMYSEYCKNCKFTSVQTLPLISYMRNSLVEIMALKPDLAYKCAFVSLKALAKKLQSLTYGHGKEKRVKGKIEKRPSKKAKKEKQESIPSVYNWPYLHSLSLWMSVVCQLKSHSLVQQLVHPAVELIIGTIRVNSSAQYYPLRFSCLRMLIQLVESTDATTFVPVLPFLTEVLDYSGLHKFGKQSSMKYCNFDTSLRMSKAEIHEKAFLDGLIDQVFELTLHYCSCFCHTVAFPEMVLSTVLNIKKFMKVCRVPTYRDRMKVLLQKVEEHSNLVKRKRDSAAFDLRDISAVECWERNLMQEKSPLTVYFEAWRKKQLEKKALLYSDKDKIEKQPEIKLKEKGPRTATAEERERFPELFDWSGDEDDSSSDEASADKTVDSNDDDEEESMESEELDGNGNSSSEDDDDE